MAQPDMDEAHSSFGNVGKKIFLSWFLDIFTALIVFESKFVSSVIRSFVRSFD